MSGVFLCFCDGIWHIIQGALISTVYAIGKALYSSRLRHPRASVIEPASTNNENRDRPGFWVMRTSSTSHLPLDLKKEALVGPISCDGLTVEHWSQRINAPRREATTVEGEWYKFMRFATEEEIKAYEEEF